MATDNYNYAGPAVTIPGQVSTQPVKDVPEWKFDPERYNPKTGMMGLMVNSVTGETMEQNKYNEMLTNNKAAEAEATKKKKAEDNNLAQGLTASGDPIRQAWDSLVDPATGKLKEGYTANISGLDPSQWEGYSKYKSEALRSGPSAWAGLQMQQNNLNAQGNKNAAARQAMSAMNQGNQNLAMRGGLSSGARGLSQRSSMRDLLMARQNAGMAGQQANLQTQTQDEQNRIGQLANLSNTENQIGQYNKNLEGQQTQFNIQNLLSEKQGERSYKDMTYQEQMKKWAANRQADATARSGGGGGGGCCFILLEARYGNGVMDAVVRKYRDEHMTAKNRRGYYKLAEVLVPLMRKYSLVHYSVQKLMADPMVAYGKAYYGKGPKAGLLLKPVVGFWLGLFDYLGGDHEFIRETGEIV